MKWGRETSENCHQDNQKSKIHLQFTELEDDKAENKEVSKRRPKKTK